MYFKDEVLTFIEEENVQFIKLLFFDVFGRQKNVSILPSRMSRTFEKGVTIDATAVTGFNNPDHSDLVLKPDPSTMTILPWRSIDGCVIYMICDLYYPDGRRFDYDIRYILQKAVKKAQKVGLTIEMAAKFEFYLLKLDELGEKTNILMDQAGYMDAAPLDRAENIRRDICLTLNEMGIEPHKSYHQYGKGQNEVDFHFNTALNAADEAAIFKWVVRSTAHLNGLWADFSPRPFKNQPGSGLHIQMRFFDTEDERIKEQFMAGILKYIRQMTLFLNPNKQSYDRFGKDQAPLFIDWSDQTRFTLLRIPALSPDIMEVRSPDCTCSVYLAFALLIEAGLKGIEDQLELIEPGACKRQDSMDILPTSLEEAKALAIESDFIANVLPDHIINTYIKKDQ
ncbi:glutamine synthetase family protein [Ileibacterium valens]|uniref:glutamine synthetase family protein n=1 Tax=Ileibacterium valens TaxID=1862668 RepID=UPI00259BE7E4|nr:glutamine synthetase family protein [Ileibacterium valens]